MYKLLIGLMVMSAVQHLGLNWREIENCRGRQCSAAIEKASRQVLKINWSAISIFPNEAQRFQ